MKLTIQQFANMYQVDKPNFKIPVEPIDITFFSASWVRNNTLLLEFWDGSHHDIKMPISEAVSIIKKHLSGKYNIEDILDFDLMFEFELSKSAQIDFVNAYLKEKNEKV